jgi:hypothetical protein
LMEREPSWGTIEKLYQLSMESESYSSSWLPRAPIDSFDNIPSKRDIGMLNRNLVPAVQVEGSSHETSNSSNAEDPLFQCIERAESFSASSASPDFAGATKSGSSSDRGNLTDIDTLDVDTSGGNTVSDQSIYGSLLQTSARNDTAKTSVGINKKTQDPISPRLQSLLVPHKHFEENGRDKASKKYLDSNEAKAHGIYAELVRRSRHKITSPLERAKCQGQKDDSIAESCKSPISPVVKRFAWQSSPAKRLERLRELHREMNAKQKEAKEAEKESLLTRRLSPARRRATKSLKRTTGSNTFVKQSNQHTPSFTTHNSTLDSNTNAVVQVFMPVTRSTEGCKKLKKDAESRDLVSLASSTRSHSLVAALPTAAQVRNAVSGKPGR